MITFLYVQNFSADHMILYNQLVGVDGSSLGKVYCHFQHYRVPRVLGLVLRPCGISHF